MRVCLNADPDEDEVFVVEELAEVDEPLDEDDVEGTEVDEEETEEVEGEELVLAELDVDTEEELEVLDVVVVLVVDLVRRTPPTAAMIIITITATMATVLETALTFLSKRTLEIKILSSDHSGRIYGICYAGKIRKW